MRRARNRTCFLTFGDFTTFRWLSRIPNVYPYSPCTALVPPRVAIAHHHVCGNCTVKIQPESGIARGAAARHDRARNGKHRTQKVEPRRFGMAKTTAIVVAKNPAGVLGDMSIVKVGLEVNMDDVISIRVSDAEGQMLSMEEQLRAKADELTEAIKQLHKGIEVAVKKTTESQLKASGTKAVKSLKALFPKAEFGIQAGLHNHGEGQACISATLTIHATKENRDAGCCGYLQSVHEIPVPAEVTEALLAVDKTTRELETVRAQAVEVKRGLSRLPQMERQVRAELSRARLGSTEEGKAILGQLDAVKLTGLPRVNIKK